MNQNLLKHVPVRLENTEYGELRERVLRRDSWRCQFCGSMTNLEVHHQRFRSHSGSDHEDNLITLCNDCHTAQHGEDEVRDEPVVPTVRIVLREKSVSKRMPPAGFEDHQRCSDRL